MNIEPKYKTDRKEKATVRYNEFAKFRRNLFLLRSFSAFSGERLAETLKLHPKKILDFEVGRCPPSFDDIRNISVYFNVTIDDLIYKDAKISFE